jgi:hypothetical protein
VKFNLKNLIWFVTISGVFANLAVGFFPFVSGLYVLGLLVCVSELWTIAQEASENSFLPRNQARFTESESSELSVVSCQRNFDVFQYLKSQTPKTEN